MSETQKPRIVELHRVGDRQLDTPSSADPTVSEGVRRAASSARPEIHRQPIERALVVQLADHIVSGVTIAAGSWLAMEILPERTIGIIAIVAAVSAGVLWARKRMGR